MFNLKEPRDVGAQESRSTGAVHHKQLTGKKQLKPEILSSVCIDSGHALQLRMQTGYDHSYYFIASFIEEHIAFHASNLD